MIRLEFKPQDCWIGVFWKRGRLGLYESLDVWVCLVPMLPIHWHRSRYREIESHDA